MLAKPIAETEGMFWAWFIHFTQDLIIIEGLLMLDLCFLRCARGKFGNNFRLD
jgi:hypothetical protein